MCPEEQIVIPEGIDRVKFESKLAIVIGKQTKMVPESEALNYVFGYTVGNDVTAPQFSMKMAIGQSVNRLTHSPLGPVIETELDTFRIHVEAKLNGVKKQDSSTELMIISIRKMISYLSSVMTLKPGDVLLIGSPVGADLV
ncbi:fumarylacetoacetate hydrolase family protein [Aeribacillus sp. FSL K6-2848]|uniref:fumarylacetoacetate hydrolase family protein n=1 Tax=Aeribacillus sp. FSL K6-2848 TaxID=2954612 RepID=UPI0030F9535D